MIGATDVMLRWHCEQLLVTLWMHSQLYSFSCLHEVKECMWDFHCFGMLRCVTSQKGEDLIYTAVEAWKHANSKYVLLFDCACSWACSSFLFDIYWWVSPSFICLLSYQLAILSFSWDVMCESCNIPFGGGEWGWGGESISRNITLLFVLCLLFSCYAEITRVMLKPVVKVMSLIFISI
jgi:hypothetical protein